MRYLSDKEKKHIIREWEITKIRSPHTGDNCPPGRGGIDAEIVFHCDEINAIPGVCTLQSCAGHINKDGSITNGGLWLKLTENMMMLFHEYAYELYTHKGIYDSITIRLQDYGDELVDICFYPQRLGEAMKYLKLLLLQLAGQNN